MSDEKKEIEVSTFGELRAMQRAYCDGFDEGWEAGRGGLLRNPLFLFALGWLLCIGSLLIGDAIKIHALQEREDLARVERQELANTVCAYDHGPYSWWDFVAQECRELPND